MSAFRGRRFSKSSVRGGLDPKQKRQSPSVVRHDSPRGAPSVDLNSATTDLLRPRKSFTRSRSPAVTRPSPVSIIASKSHRHLSPSVSRSVRSRYEPVVLLPGSIAFKLRLFPFPWVWTYSADIRKFAESTIIVVMLLYALLALSESVSFHCPRILYPVTNDWIILEITILSIATVLYSIWTHSNFTHFEHINSPASTPISLSFQSSSSQPRPPSPRNSDNRELRRNSSPITSPKKSDFGFLWMSVPKNYRDSLDDGIFTGLLLGPLIACALLLVSLRKLSESSVPPVTILPPGWRIEAPAELHGSPRPYTASESLVLSRYSLLDLATFCSTILLVHVCASWWLEAYYRTSGNAPEGERASVPRSEGRRAWYYILFTLTVGSSMLGLKTFLHLNGYGVWQHLNYFEIIVGSFFYQFTLYMALRLAHRGFTLGELALVCFGGTALCMEFLNVTIARIWPITTPFIKTYRLPTPLLIFQMALIAGSFLTGFLLSPFLVLSRHIAQRPVRRLRFPQDKQRNRRYLALGFYAGTVLIVGGLIGTWTRWCLGNRDPWLWVVFWLLEGKRKWSRPALLAYWGLLGCLSVAGWNRQLARSRKYRARNTIADATVIVPWARSDSTPVPSTESSATSASQAPGLSNALSSTFPNLPNLPALANLPNLPNLPNGTNVSHVATDLLDAADKHVPTLGLNARRKFFHALAVVMFTPGVAYDPAFAHLSFSAAFALFTFAEYVRYFAIYPFGAAVHLFMNEFLDHRDGGTAILSHFYLLTGCAGSVWLEGPTRLLQFTGLLALGVGDAMASIVGKRIGLHRWTSSSSKTFEGSIAFASSIVICAWILRLCGWAEPFSTMRYMFVVIICALLEALSDQNDNLTLPLFMWSMLVVVDV